MRRTTLFVLALTIALIAGAGVASAYGSYVGDFTAKYPAAESLANCQLCHQADYSLNSYGSDFKAAGDFAAIEGLDSDKDGVSNGDELAAGTNPADPASKPAAAAPVEEPTAPAEEAVADEGDAMFPDLVGHWSRDVVEALAEKGIVKGLPDGTFGVKEKVTKAQFATFLSRILGLPEVDPFEPAFDDVAKGSWYYKVVETLFRAGVIGAEADGLYKPDEPVTREKAAMYAVRALGLAAEAEEQISDAQVKSFLAEFSDASEVDPALAPYVAVAVKRGIMKGDGAAFRPAATLTRAEAAAILARVEAAKKTDQILAGLTNYALGPDTCKKCHSTAYDKWQTTFHAKMIQDARDPRAIIWGNWDTNPDFDLADVDLVLSVMTEQRYLDKKEDGYYFMTQTWNQEERVWEDNSVRGWSDYCAKCHTTGYIAETQSFVSLGISCESCHGNGAWHVMTGGNPAYVAAEPSNERCTSCHGSGRQGQQLEAMGHTTGFAEVIERPYFRDYCLECHSGTAFLAAEKGQEHLTVEEFRTGSRQDDRLGITCAVCHDPHERYEEHQLRKSALETCTQCHTAEVEEGATLEPGGGVHHPQKEMLLGYGAIGVDPMPSPKVVTCVDCHMTDGNHYFKVGTPTLTLESRYGPYEANSCAKCHSDMTAEAVEEVQAEIEAGIAAIHDLIEQAENRIAGLEAAGVDVSELEAAVAKAETNVEFLEADASKGIHNTPYARAIIAATKAMLEEALD